MIFEHKSEVLPYSVTNTHISTIILVMLHFFMNFCNFIFHKEFLLPVYSNSFFTVIF